jgi:hypothetical protein
MRGFVIYGPTPSITNRREHWAVRAKRAKAQRTAAFLLWRSHSSWSAAAHHRQVGCVVTLTRFGGRKLDDDNLRSALKSIRDGIADAIGLDDGDGRIEWRYAQDPPRTPPPAVVLCGVIVEVGER